ncbi:hypothetical protein LUZ60_009160 [Juncus effusus]|nr:hypothetical protein LUZ60_009160 [Juncus effusus]
MKFIYFLMDREVVHQKRLQLELEVAELQNTLEREQRLNQILQCSMQGKLVCHSCLSSFVPLQVQVLLAELAMVEEEIIYLERKLEDLKLCFSRERKQSKERRQKHNFLCGLGGRKEIKSDQELPLVPSFDLVSERSDSCSNLNDEELERPRRSTSSCKMNVYIESSNKLSEEIIKLLINIFHKLNKKTEQLEPCSNSKIDGIKDKGCSKKFVNFTRDSFDISRIALCIPDIRKLRELIQGLSFVDLSLMTYKQKLAFWINVYNSCIMHAFLHHGLPQSPEKLLGLLKKATVNVGGIILNALAIEHFILRHSSYDHTNYKGIMEEKKGFMLDFYDLEYPEPNITFALCRGSRSSPVLRVYTAEDVANQLEIAKVHYLETSIKITGKRKITVPKLLYWHMRDFADNTESLIEWIYSQLPSNGSMKRVIKELLSGDNSKLIWKTVEIEPYNSEFCYLLPV